MLFKFKTLLPFVILAFCSFSVHAQCPGNYEIDFQVDPGDCQSEDLTLTMEYLVNNEDSIKVFAFGGGLPLQNIGAGANYEIFNIPGFINTLTIIGYPSLCETTWEKADWTGLFSAGFEFVDTSDCIYINDHLLTVNPSGGWIDPNSSYSFSLIEPDGTISMGDTFQVGSGMHILEFVDEYDCVHHDSLNISPALSIISQFTVNTTDSDCNASTGTASINFINMQPPFSYDWRDESGVSFSQAGQVDQLAPGKYYIEIWDNNCGAIDSFIIDGTDIDFEILVALEPCLLDTNYVAVNILETGGGPYSFIWTDNTGTVISTEESASLFGYGAFTVEVTSPTCTTSEDFIVAPPFQVTVLDNTIDCSQSTTCVNLQVAGGIEPYSYTWALPQPPGDVLCDLTAGTYEITITDANGCSVITEFNVLQANQLLLDIQSYPNSCSGSDDGQLIATVTGGTPPYMYQWSMGAVTPAVVGVFAGTYTITVTDANGCEVIRATELEDGTIISGIEAQCVTDSTLGSIILYENNPFADLLYTWSNGVQSTTPFLDNLDVGIYSVTITNAQQTCEEVYTNIYICDDSQGIVHDLTMCKGDSLEFNITNPFGWTFISWVDPIFNGIDCDDCYDIWVYPESSTSYQAAYWGPDDEIFLETFNIEVFDDCVWPGDVDTNLIVDHFDLLPLAISLDAIGPARPEMNIEFHGHVGDNWANIIQGYNGNQKHADCDGDGVVTYIDTTAIIQNWGETYSRSTIQNQVVDGLPIFLDTDTIPGSGISVSLPLIVGTMDSMANNIYGLAFSIHFDPEVVVDGSAQLAPIDSWMSDGIDQYIMVQKEYSNAGRLDVAISRTNTMNASGFGQVADFIIIMEDDILRNRAGGNLEVEFNISNVRMINYQGEEIATSPRKSDVVIIDRILDVNTIDFSNQVELFPIPVMSGTMLQIKTKVELESYEVMSIDGRILLAGNLESTKNVLIPSDFESGMYLFRSITDDGHTVVKKIIVR